MKLINKELLKRINAVLYFCQKVKYPHKVKIFKLLYFLDFIHFKQVGRPVTDLEYFTYDMGPVPEKFHREIIENSLPRELHSCMEIFSQRDDMTNAQMFTRFLPRKRPNLNIFTKREKKIMEDLVMIFKETHARDMTEISHLKNAPWDKTVKSAGMRKKIDFFLAIDDEASIDKETAIERMNSILEMRNLFT